MGAAKRTRASVAEYHVKATWDDEAEVWVAQSNDVPGLITEAHTLETLQAKLRTLIPELLSLNNCMPNARRLDIHLHAESKERIDLSLAT